MDSIVTTVEIDEEGKVRVFEAMKSQHLKKDDI